MSRRSRSDAWMQVWLKFPSEQPVTEQKLVALEEKVRKLIADEGFTVYALDYSAKDHKVATDGHPGSNRRESQS